MWFLAVRFMTARKKQTLLTLCGVLLGTSAFVTFSGIMTGFQSYIIDQLVNNDAHIKISWREEFLTEHMLDAAYFPDMQHVFWISPPSGRKDNVRIIDPAGWFSRLEHDPRVFAYVPQYKAQALVRVGKALQNISLVGTDVEKQVLVTNIERDMKQGKFKEISAAGNRLIAGDDLLKSIGARVGNTVLISAGGPATPFKVIGSFHSGIKLIDQTTAYSALADVQRLAGAPSLVTHISIRLTDVEMSRSLAEDWQFLSIDKVESWDQANASILSVFSLQNFIRSFVTISIMVVASFGIYNVLSILVNQKRKDIGVLRSMGYTKNDIARLFLIQGLSLGIIGGTLGLAGGFLICSYIQSLRIGGFIDQMHISFSPKVYIGALLMAMVASVASSFFPARAAGSLSPIDILRSGE